jgi:MFS family permease
MRMVWTGRVGSKHRHAASTPPGDPRPAEPESPSTGGADPGSSLPVTEESRPGLRSRLAELRLDLTPLRTARDFRLLFVAETVFYLGFMVGYVTVPWQLYALTGSNFAVGTFGLVQIVPLIVAGLYGGALADRADRRRILVVAGAAQALGTAGLLVNALLPHPSVVAIYALGVPVAMANSLQRPASEALTQRVVRHDELPAAVAVGSVGAQISMLTGPAIGGLLIAQAGAAWAFGVTLAGLVVATGLFAALRPYRRSSGTRRWPGRCGRSGRASPTRCAGATCWAPTSSTSWRCCWPCRSCCSRRWPSTSSHGPSLWGCSTRRAWSALWPPR